MSNKGKEKADINRYVCPYYKRERDGDIVCEAAKFRFPDAIAKREFLSMYCGSPQDYKECAVYKILNRYYWDRKYGDT